MGFLLDFLSFAVFSSISARQLTNEPVCIAVTTFVLNFKMLFIFLLFLLSFCLFLLSLYVCDMFKRVGAHRGQKRKLDTMDLEMQMSVNCPAGVLGTKPVSS